MGKNRELSTERVDICIPVSLYSREKKWKTSARKWFLEIDLGDSTHSFFPFKRISFLLGKPICVPIFFFFCRASICLHRIFPCMLYTCTILCDSEERKMPFAESFESPIFFCQIHNPIRFIRYYGAQKRMTYHRC